ncbi:MAG: dienelactone hydrolase family protein [Capsulimonadaceae bacterium]|nr:dienelactone hydrolase family protein [Capsulimonadaceae bacterium]
MKNILTFGIAPVLALLSIAIPNMRAQASPEAIWDLAPLRQAPAVMDCPNAAPAGVKALYYKAPDYHGQPAWVFAYFGEPEGKAPSGGWPGVVLVHGGGGTAFAEWVRRWNKAGFAAIAMDLEGREPDAGNPKLRQPSPHPGPTLGTSGPAITDQFPFYAVADAIEAASYLRSRNDVNPDKIGICGISWGSIWTCLAMSVDNRFAFAIPIYGHGFMNESDAACHISSTWDPAQFLPGVRTPMLFVASTNDKNFSPAPWQKTIDLLGSNAEQLMLPRLVHSHEAAWDVPEPYRFAADIVTKKPSVPQVSTTRWYTTDSGPFANRQWQSSSADIPVDAEATASFQLITRSDGTRRSTRILFNKPKSATNTATYSESFDTMQDGTVNGQAGWKVTAGSATVEPCEGHGKAVSLAFPYSTASVDVPSMAGFEKFNAHVDLKFTAKPDGGPNATQKLIIYFSDAAGKTIAQVYHDGNGQWGVKNGDRYTQTTIPGAADPWTTITVTIDQQGKKFSLRVANGALSVPLFMDADNSDPAAGPIAKITFQRNGQGDQGLCWLDNIVLDKAVVKTSDRLDGWLESAPRFNIAQAGANIRLHVQATRAKGGADTLDWVVQDYTGKAVRKGTLAAPEASGSWDSAIDIGVLPAGYYALSGSMRGSGLVFSAAGSRPENMVSFGVLPAIAALPLKHADDSRFGMQGTTFLKSGKRLVGDPYDPLFSALGARWVNFPMSWDQLEPMHAGQFAPDAHPVLGGELVSAGLHGMSYLTTTHGVPRWAMAIPPSQPATLGATIDSQAYPPKDPAQFEAVTERIARHMGSLRRTYFPTMEHNWYQTSWEPDWHWKGAPAEYVEMASHAYAALHRGDPSAQVLGPGTGVFDKTVEWLHTMLPLGLGNSLDGFATHAYYTGEGDPNHPPAPGEIQAPEDQKVIEDMREVKSLARKYLKPGARIIQSEWGLDYKGSYALADPNLLRTISAYLVRGHIILLGEGADTTYFFYTSDYGGECGFGLTFNLTMPNPNFGAISVAPKPEFMACAAMTRVLEGTKTIGALSGLPKDVHAYAFDRAGKTVVAIWKAHGGSATVTLPVEAAPARLIGYMGDVAPIRAAGGVITLNAVAEPVYVEGVAAKKLSLRRP